jgi:hypothetical protein
VKDARTTALTFGAAELRREGEILIVRWRDAVICSMQPNLAQTLWGRRRARIF